MFFHTKKKEKKRAKIGVANMTKIKKQLNFSQV